MPTAKKDAPEASTPKIPMGISSCLLGQKVRFDSGHKHNSYITQSLGQYFSFSAFCPEVAIGLGTPREPIRLVQDNDDDAEIRCVGTKTSTLDVTEDLKNIGQEQAGWVAGVYGYIFKKDSPSCGMERVKVYRNAMPSRTGRGLFAEQIMSMFPNMPIEEEGRLGDVRLRENFVKRVFIYKRWCDMVGHQQTRDAVVDFHARHKLIYMSHNQTGARALGQMVAKINEWELDEFCSAYISRVTALMSKPAQRRNHTNVLQHIQGYLKKHLDSDDRQELEQLIHDYRLGFVPLIVPITVLRHHFRRNPSDYIDRSYYMSPHPSELMLLNQM